MKLTTSLLALVASLGMVLATKATHAAPMPATPTTVQDGLWNDPATWFSGVPSSSANTNIGHNVTLPAGSTTVGGVQVNSGGSLTIPSGSSLVLTTGALSINGGTLSGTNATIRFDHSGASASSAALVRSSAGSISLGGSSTLIVLNTVTALTLGAEPFTIPNVTFNGPAGPNPLSANLSAATITGTLRLINPQVTIAQNQGPQYDTNSILRYSVGGTRFPQGEWPNLQTGSRAPFNILIDGTTTIELQKGRHHTARGQVTVAANGNWFWALNAQSLFVGGNLEIRTGSFMRGPIFLEHRGSLFRTIGTGTYFHQIRPILFSFGGLSQNLETDQETKLFNVTISPGTEFVTSKNHPLSRVTNSLTNLGVIVDHKPVTPSFVGSTFHGWTGIRFDVAAAGNLTELQARRRDVVLFPDPAPPAEINTGMSWAFGRQPNTGATGFNLSVALPYNTEVMWTVNPGANPLACKYDNVADTWDCRNDGLTGRGRLTDPFRVRYSGITTNAVFLRPMALGNADMILDSVAEGFASVGTPVTVTWATANDFASTGFHVYRAERVGDEVVATERLTADAIPATVGAGSYAFQDVTPVATGESERLYLVESTDGAGTSVMGSPIVVTVQ